MICFYKSVLFFLPLILLFSLNLQAQSDILKKDRVMVTGIATGAQSTAPLIYSDTAGAFISCLRTVSPDTILAGSEFLVEIEIFKTENVCSLVLEETLPVGFTAVPVNTGGGYGEFKFQKLTIKWSSPPKGKISYKVKPIGPQKGLKIINGKLVSTKRTMYETSQETDSIITVPTTIIAATYDATPLYEYKIPPTKVYITNGIKLKPVNGTLNN